MVALGLGPVFGLEFGFYAIMSLWITILRCGCQWGW